MDKKSSELAKLRKLSRMQRRMEVDDARRLWPKTGATRRAKSHEETARRWRQSTLTLADEEIVPGSRHMLC